ncbi:MAG: hypothetical protein ACFFCM_17550 [Promethearchaeota archaeon]
MDKCIFCNNQTSFIFEGSGEYHGKPVCPKCQSEKFQTKFNTGCATDECSIKINRPK